MFRGALAHSRPRNFFGRCAELDSGAGSCLINSLISYTELYINHELIVSAETFLMIFSSFDRFIRRFEPYGILLAVIGLFLSLIAFSVDYRDRVEERTVRAWQLLTTKAPRNSGKKEALQYLNKVEGLFCDDDRCLITLKERTPLIGIDLSVPEEQFGVYLRGINLSDADLIETNLSGTYLSAANLKGANLTAANLSQAYLNQADLRGANLKYAALKGTWLSSANLSGASIEGTNLRSANLMNANLSGVFGLSQYNLDRACTAGSAQIPEGFRQTIEPCPEPEPDLTKLRLPIPW